MNKIILRIRRHKLLLVLFVVLLILVATSVLLTNRQPSAEALFKQVVISPVPESVKDIKASMPLDKRGRGISDHTYILRFDISREDVSKIVASGNLVEWEVVYYDFSLSYTAEGIGAGVKLYEADREVPDWFDLRRWKGFTAYYAGTERPVDMYVTAHLLLYNENLGRAYFIDHEIIGEGPRAPFFWPILRFFRMI